MPFPSSAASPWYSFDAGGVHWAMLSTEHDLSATSPQLKWLDADLAAANATWLLVGAHRFLYADSSSRAGDDAAGAGLLHALEPIFLKRSIDLVVAGHHHSYQRTCAVAAGRCSPDGPVYIVAGHAGAGLSGFSTWPRDIFVRRVSEHGYLRLAANASHLAVSSRRSSDGSEMDAVTLTAKYRRRA